MKKSLSRKLTALWLGLAGYKPKIDDLTLGITGHTTVRIPEGASAITNRLFYVHRDHDDGEIFEIIHITRNNEAIYDHYDKHSYYGTNGVPIPPLADLIVPDRVISIQYVNTSNPKVSSILEIEQFIQFYRPLPALSIDLSFLTATEED